MSHCKAANDLHRFRGASTTRLKQAAVTRGRNIRSNHSLGTRELLAVEARYDESEYGNRTGVHTTREDPTSSTALDKILQAIDPFERAAASVVARYDRTFADLAK